MDRMQQQQNNSPTTGQLTQKLEGWLERDRIWNLKNDEFDITAPWRLKCRKDSLGHYIWSNMSVHLFIYCAFYIIKFLGSRVYFKSIKCHNWHNQLTKWAKWKPSSEQALLCSITTRNHSRSIDLFVSIQPVIWAQLIIWINDVLSCAIHSDPTLLRHAAKLNDFSTWGEGYYYSLTANHKNKDQSVYRKITLLRISMSFFELKNEQFP